MGVFFIYFLQFSVLVFFGFTDSWLSCSLFGDNCTYLGWMFKSSDIFRNLAYYSLFTVCLHDVLKKIWFSFGRENDLHNDSERSLSIHMIEWKFGTLQDLGKSLKWLNIVSGMLISPNLVHIGFLIMYSYTKVFSSNCEKLSLRFQNILNNKKFLLINEMSNLIFQNCKMVVCVLKLVVHVTPPTRHPMSSEGVIFFIFIFPVYYKLINFKLVHSYNVKHLTCTIFCSNGLQNIYKLHTWKCSTFTIFTLLTKKQKYIYIIPNGHPVGT